MKLPHPLVALLLFVTIFACGSNTGSAEPTAPNTQEATPPSAPETKPTNTTPPATIPTEAPARDASVAEDQTVIEVKTHPAPQETKTSPALLQPPPPAPAAPPNPAPTVGSTPPGNPNSTSPPTVTSPTTTGVTTENPEAAENYQEVVVATPDHKPWDQILQQFVDGKGMVNYAALKKEEARLDAYLATLAEATPVDLWSHNEGLAYWINAYNAYTFKLILNNYPVDKITDLNGGDPWKVKWIKLAGKT
ncbi:MAG: DUF547 domain-containing protein, partial [Bacteroidota bacterium]